MSIIVGTHAETAQTVSTVSHKSNVSLTTVDVGLTAKTKGQSKRNPCIHSFFCFLSLGFSLFCDFLRESEVLNDEFVVLLDLRTLARAYFFCLCDGYQMLTWLFGGVVCVGM